MTPSRWGGSRLLAALAIGCAVCAAHAGPARAQFSRPYECTGCIWQWNYVDHGGQDWNCGNDTYAGHRGTDYVIVGGNSGIANGHQIMAAQAGTVTVATDGERDDCTACFGEGCGTGTPGGGFANYVILDHGDTTTTYAHMRMGSVAVQVGQQVACGDVLGEIGSAGCSSGAHLHFEPQEGTLWGTPFDPYAGGCNPGRDSAWHDQGTHRGLPGLACDVQASGCPASVGATWSCEGSDRVRCVADAVERDPCPHGCTTPNAQGAVCQPPPTDMDGDGVPGDSDCDDANPNRFPGTVDACGDGIDQDCDGFDTPCPADQRGAATGGLPSTGGTAGTPLPVAGAGGTPGNIPGARGPSDPGCGCRTLGGGPVLVGAAGPTGLLVCLALGTRLRLRRRRARLSRRDAA